MLKPEDTEFSLIYGVDITDYSRIQGTVVYSSQSSFAASISLHKGKNLSELKKTGDSSISASDRKILDSTTSAKTSNFDIEIDDSMEDMSWIVLAASWYWNVKLTSLILVY